MQAVRVVAPINYHGMHVYTTVTLQTHERIVQTNGNHMAGITLLTTCTFEKVRAQASLSALTVVRHTSPRSGRSGAPNASCYVASSLRACNARYMPSVVIFPRDCTQKTCERRAVTIRCTACRTRQRIDGSTSNT